MINNMIIYSTLQGFTVNQPARVAAVIKQAIQLEQPLQLAPVTL